MKNKRSKQHTAGLLYEVMVMYYTVLQATFKKDWIPLNLKWQKSEWSLTIKQSHQRLCFCVLCLKISELVAAFVKNHLVMRPGIHGSSLACCGTKQSSYFMFEELVEFPFICEIAKSKWPKMSLFAL